MNLTKVSILTSFAQETNDVIRFPCDVKKLSNTYQKNVFEKLTEQLDLLCAENGPNCCQKNATAN